MVVTAAVARGVTGDLTSQGCIEDADDEPTAAPLRSRGSDRPRWIAVSPDGKSAYAISELDDAIVSFGRNTTPAS